MWRRVMSGTCVAAVLGVLAGCGGSAAPAASTTNGSGGTTNGSGGTTSTIQGIATPSSVAVVTATNSN